MFQNLSGKGLEYATYRTFKAYQKTLTGSDPDYDPPDFNWQSIPIAQRNDYKTFAKIVLKYCKACIKPTSNITRSPERDGIEGLVADMRVDALNLSIKNHKSYIKSQRPNNFPAQIGLDQYDTSIFHWIYGQISGQPWLDYANNACSSIEYIRELYTAVCQLVGHYIQRATTDQLKKYFRFLTGERHYQCINLKDRVEIYDFTKTTSVQSVNVRYVSWNKLELEFDNGWILGMRIHTASSRITKKLSLKFDTTFINQKDMISFIQIPKFQTPKLPKSIDPKEHSR